MKLSDFYFDLPNEQIARFPTQKRTESRLLYVNGENGNICDQKFIDILDHLNQGDLLIFNNTRVIAARIYGRKETGGKVEILIERLVDNTLALAHVRSSKSPKEGAILILGEDKLGEGNGIKVTMVGREDALFKIQFNDDILPILERIGHIPLPPYIDRPDENSDLERYQTVYSQKQGAVAAPTAGLHFDEQMLEKIKEKGVNTAFVTLHVGAGTFQPVRCENILEHKMHAEYAEVSQEVVDAIKQTKSNGKRVIAVGTTSVRAVESAAQQSDDLIAPFFNDTQIFLYPGKSFKVFDAMLTNFHLPESTLIMLVSAFAGFKKTMTAYDFAVKNNYRFFSYGDAMFIDKNPNAFDDLP